MDGAFVACLQRAQGNPQFPKTDISWPHFFLRKERSTISCGSTETGWSRHNHRIISGSIAPPMLWLCTPIPHE